jgi:hypothetical protein
MIMSAIKPPQSILDLRAKLASSDMIERLDAVAPLLLLPKYSDVPRPGVGGTWTFDQWCDWAKSWPFTRGQATHGYTLTHAYHGLVFSMSGTPGDHLSGMASTTQFRRKLTELLENLAITFTFLIDRAIAGTLPGAPASDGTTDYVAWLVDVLKGPVGKEAATFQQVSPATPADVQGMASIPNKLKALDKEFGISGRQAFGRIGFGDVAENMLSCVKFSAKALPRAAAVNILLGNLLDELRATRIAQNEARTAQRLAERKAKERENTGGTVEKYEREVAATRAQFRTCLASPRTLLESALRAIEKQMEVAASMKFPDYPGAPKDLYERITHLESAYDSVELERDALRERVDADATVINRLEGNLKEVTNSIAQGGMSNATRKSADDLVDTILRSLTTNDLGSLVKSIKDCRDKAQALKSLLTTNPAPGSP